MWEALWLFRESVLGSVIVALGCSVVGVYVVLRRIVFVGAALAQLASAGTALGLLLASVGATVGFVTDRFFLGVVATLGGVAFFGLRHRRARVPLDSVMGAVFVVAGAAAVLLVSGTPSAEIYELFFGGDVLFIGGRQLLRLLLIVGVSLALHAAFFREFVFVSFDGEMAASLSYRVRSWNLLLFLTFGAVIAVSMDAVGVLLTFAYLVLPAITGLLLARGMGSLFAWSVSTALVGTAVGFTVSIVADLPTGSTIIAVMGVAALLAWGWRGLAGLRPSRSA